MNFKLSKDVEKNPGPTQYNTDYHEVIIRLFYAKSQLNNAFDLSYFLWEFAAVKIRWTWFTINEQLLDEVEHDIMNYQNRGLCYLPKPKAEADNTDTRYW